MGAFLKMINFILRMRNLKSIGGLDVQILTDLSLVCAKEIQTKSWSFGQFWGHFWAILRSQQLQVLPEIKSHDYLKSALLKTVMWPPQKSPQGLYGVLYGPINHTHAIRGCGAKFKIILTPDMHKASRHWCKCYTGFIFYWNIL